MILILARNTGMKSCTGRSFCARPSCQLAPVVSWFSDLSAMAGVRDFNYGLTMSPPFHSVREEFAEPSALVRLLRLDFAFFTAAYDMSTDDYQKQHDPFHKDGKNFVEFDIKWWGCPHSKTKCIVPPYTVF